LDELGNSITSNPEEDRLPILNQEQTMSLKTLRGKREGRRQNDPLFANRASLKFKLNGFQKVVGENDEPREAYYAASRRRGRGMG